jgi:hypothetical protein
MYQLSAQLGVVQEGQRQAALVAAQVLGSTVVQDLDLGAEQNLDCLMA